MDGRKGIPPPESGESKDFEPNLPTFEPLPPPNPFERQAPMPDAPQGEDPLEKLRQMAAGKFPKEE